MSYQLKLTETFKILLAGICKKYPHSQTSIESFLSHLTSSPHQGDVYPGFPVSGLIIIKVRIALKEYKLSKRRGPRLIYAIKDKTIVPIFIYKKGNLPQEHQVKKQTIAALKSILEELQR